MAGHSKRSQIVEAGLDLVHRQGFASSGVAAIAVAGGAPKGSFYNHFASKDVFGVAVLDKYFEEVRAEFAELLADTAGTPLGRLQRYFDLLREGGTCEGYARGCLVGNFSAEVTPTSPVIRARLQSILSEWRDAIAVVVQQAQDAGQARQDVPAGTLAALIIDAWQGALLRAKVERTSAALDGFAQVLLPSVLGADTR